MTHEHETVVVTDGNGNSMGVILGIIAVIVLVVAVWFLFLGPGHSGSSTTNNNNSTTNNGGNNAVPSVQAPASS
jgi:uncharacterized membrane protein